MAAGVEGAREIKVSGIDLFYNIILHEGQHVADQRWMAANMLERLPPFTIGDGDGDGLPDLLDVARGSRADRGQTYPALGSDVEASAYRAERHPQDGLRLKDWADPGKQHGKDLAAPNTNGEINPYDN